MSAPDPRTPAAPERPRRFWRLPSGVWALGMVSLCMDMSSEMIHALLPVYLVTTLGVSVAGLGWIEGAAESTAAMMKLFSGAWSDRLGRRKPLAVLGYAMAAATKPLFPLASGAGLVFAARILDRIGKGIRGAPRDALVADLTPPDRRGAAYGLRQMLDTIGACLGPLVAAGLLWWGVMEVRALLWWAVLPALASVAILLWCVHEPTKTPGPAGAPRAWLWQEKGWRAFPSSFWRLVGLVVLFTGMRFSEAFLVLRAQDTGLGLAAAPLALVVMNCVYAFSAYPAGVLSDRLPRSRLLVIGCAVMAAADALLAWGSGAVAIFVGVAAWGLHMGLTEGLLNAWTADHAPEGRRGLAFGIVNFVRGVTLLLASALAGALWSGMGPAATFAAGVAFAAATAAYATWAMRSR